MSVPQYYVTLTDIYMVSSSEMEGMGKEAIVTKFIVISRHLPQATKCFLRDSNWRLPEYRLEFITNLMHNFYLFNNNITS
jgi:hypothetical protein